MEDYFPAPRVSLPERLKIPLKVAAAERNQSVTEFCRQAILSRLESDRQARGLPPLDILREAEPQEYDPATARASRR